MSIKLIIILLAAFVAVFVIWRLASNRHSIPCPVWLSWMVEMDNPFTKTNRAAEIIAKLNLEPGMVVLDAGCGPGRLAIPMAQQLEGNGKVVALDLQAGMLERAREKARQFEVENIEFIEAALGEGFLNEEQFDRILLVTVLGEIPEKQAALEEIHKSLKSDGMLSVTEIIFDPHFIRRKTLTRLCESAGLREKDFFGNSIAYTMHFEKQ